MRSSILLFIALASVSMAANIPSYGYDNPDVVSPSNDILGNTTPDTKNTVPDTKSTVPDATNAVPGNITPNTTPASNIGDKNLGADTLNVNLFIDTLASRVASIPKFVRYGGGATSDKATVFVRIITRKLGDINLQLSVDLAAEVNALVGKALDRGLTLAGVIELVVKTVGAHHGSVSGVPTPSGELLDTSILGDLSKYLSHSDFGGEWIELETEAKLLGISLGVEIELSPQEMEIEVSLNLPVLSSAKDDRPTKFANQFSDAWSKSKDRKFDSLFHGQAPTAVETVSSTIARRLNTEGVLDSVNADSFAGLLIAKIDLNASNGPVAAISVAVRLAGLELGISVDIVGRIVADLNVALSGFNLDVSVDASVLAFRNSLISALLDTRDYRTLIGKAGLEYRDVANNIAVSLSIHLTSKLGLKLDINLANKFAWYVRKEIRQTLASGAANGGRQAFSGVMSRIVAQSTAESVKSLGLKVEVDVAAIEVDISVGLSQF